MSFVGKLDQFKLPDLLQIVSTTGKTGKLSLTRRDSQGVIVFRGGKIIYAASSAARQTLGSLLLCHNHLTEEQLAKALEIQHQAAEEKRLGTILTETGMISEETLKQVVVQQIEDVVSEFMQWTSGFFKFDLLRLPDKGEIEVDAEDFLHSDGLSTQQVLLDITTRLDELEEEARRQRGSADDPAAPPADEPPPTAGGSLGSLKSIMAEIRSPEFTGEATGRILAFARRELARGALFVVRRDGFYAVSRFGSADEEAEGPLRLPLDQPSVLAEAADRKAALRGPLADTTANRHLIQKLGSGQPAEALVIPLVVNDNVLLLLYGDNVPTGETVAGEQVELLMLQVGLAMERNLLKKRLEVLEGLRAG